ncbi:MAG: hypothetical protein KGL26_06060 [Pseudomonadota bacterium]|nr:hypothetical protein [Pseudomonadota bacterium]
MRKIALSAIAGVIAAALVSGAYFGARYAGLAVSPELLMGVAATLAFGASTAGFMLMAMSKTGEKKKVTRSTPLSDLPAKEFVQALCEDKAVQIVMRPDSLAETLDVVKHSSSYLDRPVLVTIKKSKDTRVFNPIVLKQLFAALKPFPGFLHILLTNEHDEFVGYIPAWRARTDFTGANAETKIREYIVDVLADPSTSTKLRDIGGLAMEDWISDGDTVAAAARKTSEGLLRGLVICKSGRKRKPYGVIFTEELYKLAVYGA